MLRKPVLMSCLGIFLAAAEPLSACLSTRLEMDLWHAVHNAELIVEARLVDIEVNHLANEIDLASDRASMLLAQTGLNVSLPQIRPAALLELKTGVVLKGQRRPKVVLRAYGLTSEDTTGRDGPAIYFLHREDGAWALTRYPIFYRDWRELYDLRGAILSALELGEEADADDQLEWRVERTSRAGSRPYVVDRLSFRGTSKPYPSWAVRRLAAGFVEDPAPHQERAFVDMLHLLAGHTSKAVDEVALVAWQKAGSWARQEAVPYLKARFAGRPELVVLAQ